MKPINRFRIINKVFFVALLGLFIISVSAVFAQDYPFQYGTNGLKSAPDITECSRSVPGCILWAFNFIFSVLIYIAGAIAVIMFIWAGILYISKPDKASEIHSRLYWGAIGLIVALCSFGIVKVIEFSVTKSGAANINTMFAQVNPLNQFLEKQENIRPSGISGCESAKSIFELIRNGQMENVPSGLLGKCILGFMGTKLLPVIYTIALLWSVGVLLWIGIEYASSHGDIKNLHEKLRHVVIGVIITVIAFSVVKAIEIALTVPENTRTIGEGQLSTTAVKKCEPSITVERVAERLPDVLSNINYVAEMVNRLFKNNEVLPFVEIENEKMIKQDLIRTKAKAEEIKCIELNAGEKCENNSCIQSQVKWATKIRKVLNEPNLYEQETANQSLIKYLEEYQGYSD